jgi:hypothetical protein
MKRLSLPKGWTVEKKKAPDNKKILGEYWLQEKKICLYPRWWTFGFIMNIVKKHEIGHANGLAGHKKVYCLMHENKDNWLEKIEAAIPVLVHRLFTGDWLCKDCRKDIDRA